MYEPNSLIEDGGDVCIRGAEDIIVAHVAPVTFMQAGGTFGQRPDVETARLFAAAPDMLAALNECAELLEFMMPPEGYSPDGALANARAAIAKATGE